MADEHQKQSRTRGLKPCKPGETHNPNGRPTKGNTLRDIAQVHGLVIDPDKKKTRVEAALDRLYRAGMKGNPRALVGYLDRVLGKPEQPLVGDTDRPIRLVIDWRGKAGE